MNRRLLSRRGQGGGVAVALVALLLACSTIYVTRSRLDTFTSSYDSVEHPPLYLPEVRYVKLITLGYDGFASKLLWFQTINYFGRQFAAKHDYQWLGNMCELVTELDPNARHAFEFCGTLLSWVAKEPERSTALLTNAIEHDPQYWRYRYMRGFNYWYFLDRLDLAKEDFKRAAEIPNTPAFVASLASRLIAKDQGPGLARQFLEEMLANTSDPAAKQALARKLRQARLSESLALLTDAVTRFRESGGSYPDDLSQLVASGTIRAIPVEPFGGSFYFDKETQTVKTTSNKRGLVFHGKNAATSPIFGAEQ
ncbi:MAG: hypothetical protein U0136_19080 [Bdellovibrionota bacterium]